MKKLILTLLITLSSLVTFAQEPLFGRAYEFHFGKISYSDEIEWVRKPTPVDIIVQFNKGEIIIFSEEHQVYQITKEMGRRDETIMWEATDKRGIVCWIFVTIAEDYYQGQLAVTIRYSDYAWMYICRESK